jgi:hypothetical protein
MRQLLITVTLALAVVFAALAQNPPGPDLSGTWILNSASSKLMTGNHIQTETLVIAYTGADIQFHFHAVPSGKDWTMTYTLDGKEHATKTLDGNYGFTYRGVPVANRGNPLPSPCSSEVPPQQLYTKANWHKSELSVQLRSRSLSGAGGICGGEDDHLLSGDRWSLSPDGRVLSRISEAVQTTETRYPKQVLVYDKQ